MDRLIRKLILLVILLTWTLNTTAAQVLLTLDVERESDVANVNALNINVPATYFVLGEFAKRNIEFVHQLSKGNTIGSHGYSHENMIKLSDNVVDMELTLSKVLLEQASNRPVEWFRAPFLESSNNIMEKVVNAGYRYDSTQYESWFEEQNILGLPISADKDTGILTSDYDLFFKSKMNDAQALNFLSKQYLNRKDTGQPLVILLHPGIIVEHQKVLHDFIAIVKKDGGTFLTADQWISEKQGDKEKRIGVWIDQSIALPDITKLKDNLAQIGTTDVFLMARDYGGQNYFLTDPNSDKNTPYDSFHKLVQEIKSAGIKVHAWLPLLLNPAIAQQHPDWAMRSVDETPSIEWISPDHPEVVRFINNTVVQLLKHYPLDGIHLDYVRFPDTGYDVSNAAINEFSSRFPAQNINRASLLSEHYTEFSKRKQQIITNLVHSIRETVNKHQNADKPIELSAALIAQAALSSEASWKFGQDYKKLAHDLDLVIPMAYFKWEQRPPEWISRVLLASRYQIGERKLLSGLLTYQQPQSWILSDDELKDSLKAAMSYSDGVVFYNYSNLFAEGHDTTWNMPASSINVVRSNLTISKPTISDIKEASLVEAMSIQQIHEAHDQNIGQANSQLQHTLTTQQQRQGISRMVTSDHVYIVILVIFILSMVGLFVRIRSNGMHAYRCSKSTMTPRTMPSDLSEFYLRDLENRLYSARSIDTNLFNEASSILQTLGAQKIASFKRTQLLQFVNTLETTVDGLLKVLLKNDSPAIALRRIEESSTLDYVKISVDGDIRLTELGQKILKKGVEEGFSEKLVTFIENALSEEIVLSCPHCEARTIGQWFWENFECSGCNKKMKVIEARNIFIRRWTERSPVPEME